MENFVDIGIVWLIQNKATNPGGELCLQNFLNVKLLDRKEGKVI